MCYIGPDSALESKLLSPTVPEFLFSNVLHKTCLRHKAEAAVLEEFTLLPTKRLIVSLKIHMLKPQPLVCQNVTVFKNRAFKEVID